MISKIIYLLLFEFYYLSFSLRIIFIHCLNIDIIVFCHLKWLVLGLGRVLISRESNLSVLLLIRVCSHSIFTKSYRTFVSAHFGKLRHSFLPSCLPILRLIWNFWVSCCLWMLSLFNRAQLLWLYISISWSSFSTKLVSIRSLCAHCTHSEVIIVLRNTLINHHTSILIIFSPVSIIICCCCLSLTSILAVIIITWRIEYLWWVFEVIIFLRRSYDFRNISQIYFLERERVPTLYTSSHIYNFLGILIHAKKTWHCIYEVSIHWLNSYFTHLLSSKITSSEIRLLRWLNNSRVLIFIQQIVKGSSI